MATATLERPITTVPTRSVPSDLHSSNKTAKHKASSSQASRLEGRGKEAAARFLARRGYEILERDWVTAFGTADIIAKDEDAIVFVEVSTVDSASKGFPEEMSDQDKRDRLERIALAFLSEYETHDMSVRFDVISIVVLASDRALIRHHINALSVA